MPHHFPKATVEASAYCTTCGKMTPHYVFDGRLGRCKNDHHPTIEGENLAVAQATVQPGSPAQRSGGGKEPPKQGELFE
jgi:hypothetical protein